MLANRPRRLIFLIALLILVVVVWPIFAGFYTELLWYDHLGYSSVMLTSLWTKIMLGLVVGLISTGILLVNYRTARRLSPHIQPVEFIEIDGERLPAPNIAVSIGRFAIPLVVLVGLFFTSTGWSAWETYLRFRHQVAFGGSDPIFGRNISFYVFTLPMLESIGAWLTSLTVVCFITALLVYGSQMTSQLSAQSFKLRLEKRPRRHLLVIAAVFFALVAFENYLKIPNLMLSDSGAVFGAGYTDLNYRLPIYRVQIVLALLVAALAVASIFRHRLTLLWAGLAVYALALGVGLVVPAIVQRINVVPNELAKETPYIKHNIAATRQAFGLDQIEERELSSDLPLTAKDIQENQATINNIRLWNEGPLLETFAQIQEIRSYYDFKSVDNDRYMIDGNLQQVMLSARELPSSSLQNRNWINERLTFTHGYGLTLGPVDQVTPEGLPVLFIKDLPPHSSKDSLKIERPEVYFGELTSEHVYVRTQAREFDYPSGEQNVYTTYEGEGGIPIGSLWRRLLFATRLGDSKLLLSDDLTSESRVMMRRNILDRLRAVAPFLIFDSDPYLVISEGRLFWLADAYTTTDRYPYSEPATQQINYIRNSVKAVVDAYHGHINLYIADAQDPIINTYAKIFPGILKPLSEMPEDLRAHIRYPELIFRIQSAVYSTYHMDDPQIFYNKEDQWAVASVNEAQEGGEAQPLEPYYTIMKVPGEQSEEFILMLPFTPRRKDNLASWMVARSDGDKYGKLAVYKFPKQKLVFGPRQVVQRINQDPEISRQLALWSRSSQVNFGTLMVIPIKESLLYIYPLYLRAASGNIPELRRVIVVADNRIAMEPTLAASLNRLFGESTLTPQTDAPSPTPAETTAPTPGEPTVAVNLAEKAKQHFDRMDQARRDGDWARFGEEWRLLGQVLDQMNQANQR